MSCKALSLIAAAVMLFSPIAHAQDVALKVEIKPEQMTVKNTQQLAVHTKISNTSDHPQELQIWSCSYPEHWRADNPAVRVQQVECNKNALLDVVLKPGEAHERALSVRVSVAAEELQQESVTFRLGFEPRITGMSYRESPPIVWSNPVTVQVTEPYTISK